MACPMIPSPRARRNIGLSGHEVIVISPLSEQTSFREKGEMGKRLRAHVGGIDLVSIV